MEQMQSKARTGRKTLGCPRVAERKQSECADILSMSRISSRCLLRHMLEQVGRRHGGDVAGDRAVCRGVDDS